MLGFYLMRTRRRLLLSLIILIILFLGWSAFAITLAEIAGTYEGWRTETSPTGTIRYLEMDQILPDGTFNTWLFDEEHGIVIAQTSVITLDEDGNITGPWAGYLKIHGPQLQIKARVGEFAVHAVTHRGN
jgi:hypothetical protein